MAKRRRYVTHPRFQFSFVMAFVFGMLFIVAAIGGSASYTLLLLAKESGLTVEQQTTLLTEGRDLIAALINISIPALLFFGAIGFFLSYRFVGPIDRLEHWVDLHLRGKHPHALKLRSDDELGPLAKILDQILNKKHGKKES